MIEESIIREFEELYKDISLLEFDRKKTIFKREYKRVQSPIVKRKWKNYIYSLKMAEYKKEKIWEYLNDDLKDDYFEHFVEGVHKGWFK